MSTGSWASGITKLFNEQTYIDSLKTAADSPAIAEATEAFARLQLGEPFQLDQNGHRSQGKKDTNH
jgi:hypothetical protein